MKTIGEYRVILWDFDGVIMDSMPVRDKGFIEVLKDYPDEEVQELMVYHRANGGLSRYAKFRYFFEKIRGEVITDERLLEFAAKFSKVMLDHLINPDLFIQDSLQFIQDNYERHEMNVVSGSDGNELNIICKELDISRFFRSISGSPTPKTELVANILSKLPYDKSEVVLIGDSVNDWQAANKNGIDFYGYNNNSLKKLIKDPIGYIDSFSDLK